MTYPKGLEKIVDKKYAYPAWLFALAIVFSLLELFIVNFDLNPSFLFWNRLGIAVFCIVMLILFAFMRKNVNFYDVTATCILAMILVADALNIIVTTEIMKGGQAYTPVVDIFPSGLLRYRMVPTEINQSGEASGLKYSFSFAGLLQGLFLLFIEGSTVAEKRVGEDKAERLDGTLKKIWKGTAIAAALLTAVFLILLFAL